MATVLSTEARQDLLALGSDGCRRHPRPRDLDPVEACAEEARQLVGEVVLEASLQGLSGKASYQGTPLPRPCGARARFVGYRPRWIKSTCAQTQVARASTASVEPVAPLAPRAVGGRRLYVGTEATPAPIDWEWPNVQSGIVFTGQPDAQGRDTLLERAYGAGRRDREAWGGQLRTLSTLWHVEYALAGERLVLQRRVINLDVD